MSDRVAWTQTLNLSTDNPYRAARMMAATVGYAPALKQRASVKDGGRKLANPVAHFSLSYKEGERPPRPGMLEAARSCLKTLGLEDHQALVVAHCDTKNSHVHVIANRVSCEDGRAANLGRSHRVLSRWAENYERSQREIQCWRRVENNRRRADGEKKVYDEKSPSKASYHREPLQDGIGRCRYVGGNTREEQAQVEKLRAAEERLHDRCRSSYRERYATIHRNHNQQWHKLYKAQEKERSDLKARLAKAPHRESQGYDPEGKLDKLAGRHKEERGNLGRRQANTKKELRNLYVTEYASGLPTHHDPISARIEANRSISAAQRTVLTALQNETGRGGGGGGSPVPPEMKKLYRSLGFDVDDRGPSMSR